MTGRAAAHIRNTACAALISVFIALCCFNAAYAKDGGEGTADEGTVIAGLIEEFDFGDIDDSLRQIFPEARIKFSDILGICITGEGAPREKGFFKTLFDHMIYELKCNKKSIAMVLLISVAAALFTNFSGAFGSGQASEMSFYVLYMLLLAVCLGSFHVTMSMTQEKIGILLNFMRLLCPSYFMAVAMATGLNTSLMFYNIVLFTIFAAELLIQTVMLPAVNIYVIVSVMNYLTGETYLSHFSDLLSKLVNLGLKAIITFVTGINMIQGMLAPAMDIVKRSALRGAASSIPAIGNAIGGASDVLLASAVLIRNGIGAAGAILIVAICAVPAIHTALLALVYKLAAAAAEPVSDRRITGCISSLSDAYGLLLKIIFSAALLFLITVAVLAFTAGKPT